MDFKDLTSGKYQAPTGQSAGQPVSSGNHLSNQQTQPSLLPREPNTPPYRTTEANIQIIEPIEVFLPHGRKHAEKFGVKLVMTLEQALNMRRQKLAVLTPREADTLARGNVPLNSDFMHKALQAMDGMVSEGIPGEKDNAFVLRESYNRGINFKRMHYHKVDQDRQAKADAALAEIVEKLNRIKLPLWPEEVDNGVVTELCKPEYMNWEQYRAAASHYISRDPEEFEGDFHEQDTYTLGELSSIAGDAVTAGSD